MSLSRRERLRRLRRRVRRLKRALAAASVPVATAVCPTPAPATAPPPPVVQPVPTDRTNPVTAPDDPECLSRGYKNCEGLVFHPTGIIGAAHRAGTTDLPVLWPEAHCGIVIPRYFPEFGGPVLICG